MLTVVADKAFSLADGFLVALICMLVVFAVLMMLWGLVSVFSLFFKKRAAQTNQPTAGK